MAFTRNAALERALDVIKVGLSNGSIKLQGAAGHEKNNAENIKFDSDYINGMINAIAQNLTSDSGRAE